MLFLLNKYEELIEFFSMAIFSIRMHKARAILTTIGIIIGIASVVTISILINGYQNKIENDINEMGSNVIYITRHKPISIHFGPRIRKPVPNFYYEDAIFIKNFSNEIEYISPIIKNNRAKITNKNRDEFYIEASGVTEEYIWINSLKLICGRFINSFDVRSKKKVVILGYNLAEKLFLKSENALNKYINLQGRKFLVIGILEKQESTVDNDLSNLAIIPYTSFLQIFGKNQSRTTIIAKCKDIKKIDKAIEEITTALRIRRGLKSFEENNFYVFGQEMLIDMIKNIIRAIFLAGAGITSLSLLVGGIGVMNIMLISVTERTKEIGIRKAIGAKSSDIVMQFLLEAIIISILGGILGLIFGFLLGYLIAFFAKMAILIDIKIIFLSLIFSSGVGIIFGSYPAFKASKLDPIIALRTE